MSEDHVDVRIDQDLLLDDIGGVGGLPLHRGLGDDLHVGIFGDGRLEALLDVQRIAVARVAENLQDGALDRAVALLEHARDLARRDHADLDVARHGGEVDLGAADQPVIDDDRNPRRPGLFDAGNDGLEVDRVEYDRRGLEFDRVFELVEL